MASEIFKDISYLVLWMTSDCNLDCRYCYADAGRNKDYMNLETAKKALSLPSGPFKLQLAGGEPLLNFKLVEAIDQMVKENGLETKIQIQTNGSLIDEKMAVALKKMGVRLGISLDGPPAVNEKMRGKTSAVINGVKELGAQGLKVNLNAVICHETIKTLPDLVNMAYYLGNVAGIGLDLLRETRRVKENNISRASCSDLRKYLRIAYQQTKGLAALTGKRIVIREIEDARRRLNSACSHKDYCYASRGQALVVLPNGDLYPCGTLINDENYFMGNLYEPQSYRIVKLKPDLPKSCTSCQYEAYCAGSCPARSIVNGGGKPDSMEDCALRKAAFEIIKEEEEKDA
ncbi:MAG: radical SAM protein [Eubacteriaceae bacterium]